ncbi:hypothetical protein JYQ62_11875 [Nostoc sp. UHCC 0702]|nr:hypothetical protein JYQ62_11875 [Nostoc sp. UHCC 0702]
MPNPKGNPENLKNFTTNREKPLKEYLHLRITEEMKQEIQQQEDPPEFCRQAIQKALDEQNKQK